MRRFVVLSGLLCAIVLLSATAVTGQDRKVKNKQLPQSWGKLGLSEDQKKKIYAVQDEYGGKIADLRKQIDDLTKKEREEMAAVLTDEQKDHLKKLLTEKVPDSKSDKKGDGKSGN
jgi:Spy/CpxP family protein refolding chaperone